MPPFLSLSPRACLPTPTLLSLLSIPWSRKHTTASAVGDVHLVTSSPLLPKTKPPLWSSITWYHLPLVMPLPLWQIPHTHHRDSADFIVVPKSSPPLLSSSIPCTRCIFLSSADFSVVVVNSAGHSAWHRQLSPSCTSLWRIISNYFPPTPPLLLPISWPVFLRQLQHFEAIH